MQEFCQNCPLAHNPNCKFYSSPTGCKHGDKCLSPHRERGGLMALRSPLSKRETFIENWKLADALHPTPKAKPKGKVQVKANAKAAKGPASVLPNKYMNSVDKWRGGAQSSS